MSVKLITPITVDIETADDTKSFDLRIQKMGKKEKKLFKSFLNEQEQKHKQLDEASLRLNKEKSLLDELVEDIKDIEDLIQVSADADKTSLITQKMELRQQKRKQDKIVEEGTKTLREFEEEFNDLQEESYKKVYALQTVEDGGLAAYIEKHSIPYVIVLEEIKALVTEANKKK